MHTDRQTDRQSVIYNTAFYF